jgi:integrase/recombinase XerD
MVTEHTDLGFKPKDSEEGTIPLFDPLIETLRQRRRRYPNSRPIFPGRGKVNVHMLRTIKALALRAGINCGHCTN